MAYPFDGPFFPQAAPPFADPWAAPPMEMQAPDIMDFYEPPQMQSPPDDFFARLGQSQGPQPFQFQPRQGRNARGIDVILAALQGFGNARAAQGVQRTQQVQQGNEQAKEGARQMAYWRWKQAAERRQTQDNRDRIELSRQKEWADRRLKDREFVESVRHNKAMESRPSGGGSGTGYSGFDPEAVAAGIRDGTIAPDPAGFSRGQWGAIATSIRKQNPQFNLQRAAMDHRGVRQFVQSLNQSQQVRLRQSAQNANKTAAFIEGLIDDIKAKAPPRTPITAINGAQLTAIKNGAWGPEAQEAATKLEAQIAAYRMEMPTIYSGGYAPMEQHMREASKLIDSNWSLNRIQAGLEIGKVDTKIRLDAVNEIGAVTPSNPLAPGQQTPSQFNIGPNAIGSGASAGGGAGVAGQAQTDRVRVIDPKGRRGSWKKSKPLPAGWRLE